MKNLILVAVLLLIVSSLSFGQSAQVTATVNAVLSISAGTPLNLGIVQKGTTRTILSTDATAAAFSIAGEPNTSISVTVAFPLNLSDGTNNLSFTGQIPIHNTTNIQGGASTVDFALTGGTASTSTDDGDLYVWMGGGVSPGALQASGNYTGTINVSVAYP